MIGATPLYAIALDVRRVDTDALLGVALLVSSRRHLAYLSIRDGVVSEPSAGLEIWRAIDEWNDQVARHLPFKPPAMSSAMATVLFGAGETPVVARRFAAIPITPGTLDQLAGLLPGLLNARRRSQPPPDCLSQSARQ